MPDSLRVIRGDEWAACLKALIGSAPQDMFDWMDRNTRVLKSDIFSVAGQLELEGQTCFLKFYHYKSFFRRILFALHRAPALRSYEAALALHRKGVPVPLPLACLRLSQGMLLLLECIPGEGNLAELWRDPPTEQRARQIMHATGCSLALVHLGGYFHGDCKWNNLFWIGEQVFLVDLDAANRVRRRSARDYRDVARFTLDAEERGVDPGLYDCFLESYLEAAGKTRQEVMAGILPFLEKFRARHRVRYGSRGRQLL